MQDQLIADVDSASEAPQALTTRDHVRRMALMFALYSGPLFIAMRKSIATDADLYWHLRTGRWIFDHHALPYVDYFSQHGMGKPWEAYSWLYEIVLYGLFTKLGMAGVLVYTLAMTLIIALALHSLVRRFQQNYAFGILITALGMFAMGQITTPRSWLPSMLFFILQLDIVLDYRETGNWKRLLWLPVIYAVWANVHIQFIYGLAVLGIATIEPLMQWAIRKVRPPELLIRFRHFALASIASALAVLVNPYGIRLYKIVILFATGKFGLKYIAEMQAMGFRDYPHYLILAVTLLAAYFMGRRGKLEPFTILLLVLGCYVGFRSARDVWFLVIGSVGIIAVSAPREAASADRYQPTRAGVLVVCALVALTTIMVAKVRHFSNASFAAYVAEHYPVAATQYIKDHHLQGPLFNDFDWGGYLIWRLPELPVSMDGRINLQGDEVLTSTLSAWNGQKDWQNNEDLKRSRLVIGQITEPLTQLLRVDPQFQLVYEDKVAAVFVRR